MVVKVFAHPYVLRPLSRKHECQFLTGTSEFSLTATVGFGLLQQIDTFLLGIGDHELAYAEMVTLSLERVGQAPKIGL